MHTGAAARCLARGSSAMAARTTRGAAARAGAATASGGDAAAAARPTNRLATEQSPYLLQHKHNPVSIPGVESGARTPRRSSRCATARVVVTPRRRAPRAPESLLQHPDATHDMQCTPGSGGGALGAPPAPRAPADHPRVLLPPDAPPDARRSTGTRGARRPSRWRAAPAGPSFCRSATRRATGAVPGCSPRRPAWRARRPAWRGSRARRRRPALAPAAPTPRDRWPRTHNHAAQVPRDGGRVV